MSKLEIYETSRRALNADLNDAWHKESDFIEVTEWSNGEGYDVTLSTKSGNHSFSLHFTEWKVLKKLIKKLEG